MTKRIASFVLPILNLRPGLARKMKHSADSTFIAVYLTQEQASIARFKSNQIKFRQLLPYFSDT